MRHYNEYMELAEGSIEEASKTKAGTEAEQYFMEEARMYISLAELSLKIKDFEYYVSSNEVGNKDASIL